MDIENTVSRETPDNPKMRPRYANCPEDCPRCNRCPPNDPRRMIIDALVIGTELEKERSEASVGLQSLLPPLHWHEMVLTALAK